MANENADTDQIEQDLARTRARMDERLDALQDKMSPAQLVNDAFSHIGGNDGGAFTENLIIRAKANPLAVALVGVGFAWLMMPNPRTGARGLSVYATRTQVVTALSASQERSRMAGLAQRLGGDVGGWDALGPQEP